MIFALLGGDDRMARLARMLASDGEEVRVFALGAVPGAWSAPCAGACCAGADCVVLPMPVVSAPGMLFSPAGGNYALDALLSGVPKTAFLCGGRVDADTASRAAALGLRIRDYFAREEMTVGNAAATAEGALERLIRETPATLLGSSALVLGFGRIGKLLALRLRDIGVRVTVAARKGSDRAWACALGMEAVDYSALPEALAGFDSIVNTVPAMVLPEELLARTKENALILDLASRPGGVDFAAAAGLGLKTIWALSLPGRVAPKSAGVIIKDTVLNILKEEGEAV